MSPIDLTGGGGGVDKSLDLLSCSLSSVVVLCLQYIHSYQIPSILVRLSTGRSKLFLV